jgi:hypothetical protein
VSRCRRVRASAHPNWIPADGCFRQATASNRTSASVTFRRPVLASRVASRQLRGDGCRGRWPRRLLGRDLGHLLRRRALLVEVISDDRHHSLVEALSGRRRCPPQRDERGRGAGVAGLWPRVAPGVGQARSSESLACTRISKRLPRPNPASATLLKQEERGWSSQRLADCERPREHGDRGRGAVYVHGIADGRVTAVAA